MILISRSYNWRITKSCYLALSSEAQVSHSPKFQSPDCRLKLILSSHVHLNQPGRTAWEGFQSGTLAAISGGITTLIDMPLNSIPPTTTVQNLEEKREEARKVGVNCDIGFWGGIIPGNQGELRGLMDAGVKGFKCFLINSGVEVSSGVCCRCAHGHRGNLSTED